MPTKLNSIKIDSIDKLDDFIYLLEANNISLESITINSSEILKEIKNELSFYYAPQLDKCELNTASYKGVRVEDNVLAVGAVRFINEKIN